jgi:hypothetical protein
MKKAIRMREHVEFSPGKIHESVEGRVKEFSTESFSFLSSFLQRVNSNNCKFPN